MDEPNPDCMQAAGVFMPIVDRNRCEGKQECVKVCPYQVFSMMTVPPEERSGLTLRGKVKGYVHKWHQAYAVNSAACHACGLCVSACPEKAITLVRV
jgi:NAD-dependent dihydropyrimidine dehydrogenase PreA subunit